MFSNLFKRTPPPKQETLTTEEEVIAYVKSLRFRTKLYGINEADVWTVISNIQKYYEAKYREQEIRIETLEKSLKAASTGSQIQAKEAGEQRL